MRLLTWLIAGLAACTSPPDSKVGPPDTDAPDTDAPDTDAPDTDVPDTDVPDTDVPDTDVPDTDVPDTGAAGPDLETVDPVTLPAPTSYGLPPTRGFTVNARVHPHGLPAVWRVEYGRDARYGQVSADRALPGKLAACFEARWEDGLEGWAAGMSGRQLAHHPSGGPTGGPFVRYTDDQGSGDDTNHYEGIGAIHLGPYAYIGNFGGGAAPAMYLGGGFPDLRGARFSASLRGVGWDARGTELGTWIQGARDTSAVDRVPEDLRFPNWAHTGELQTSHLASGAWEAAAWTLRSRSADWTFAGTYGGRMTYDYGELDALLSKVNVDLFALQMLYVDIFDEPSGSWDMADLAIVYRQHSVTAPSNGGALVAEPPGGTGAELLTDGWRNGPGREWASGPDPVAPAVFEYTFARPLLIDTLNVHNATEHPSRDVVVEVSADGLAWAEIASGTLPQASALGPNYLFLHADKWELVDGVAMWTALHPVPVTRLRVTVTSGYDAARWGLGEIEVFGRGALEETEDAWYDVSQDVLVASGEWHFRVLAETDAGVVTGPDQVVEVP